MAPYPVIVAEDDPAMRDLLLEALEGVGCAAEGVPDGRALLRRLDEGPCGAVVTDLRMPGLDGMGVLAALRERRAAPPVFLVTAFGSPEVHARARALGAAGVLDKPVDVDALCALVARSLRTPGPRGNP